MDADAFCEWLEWQLFPALEEHGLEGVLVMDNASYHVTAEPGSVVPKAWKNKGEAYEFLDQWEVPHRKGRAHVGDTLEELKELAQQ